MSIEDLADGYKKTASIIRKQTKNLREAIKEEPEAEERAALRSKLAKLSTILTEMNDLSSYLSTYYEKKFVYTKLHGCKISDFLLQEEKTRTTRTIDPTSSITQNSYMLNSSLQEED